LALQSRHRVLRLRLHSMTQLVDVC
jgi:hypothetical protein